MFYFSKVEIISPSYQVPRVAFEAYRTSTFGKKNAIITYSGTSINIGNCMNPATGIFTAPIDGYYFFTFQGIFARILNTSIKIVLNGKRVSSSHYNFSGRTVSNE